VAVEGDHPRTPLVRVDLRDGNQALIDPMDPARSGMLISW
jgi:hypothetical protein